jgi:2-keto-4-pentenoate hydratase/2-oxohepta-3-ene-1,7-dioic acid hydratase in catechol pathway
MTVRWAWPVRPPESTQLDYEGEIAIVVGASGRRIPEDRARRHIAGLTVMNEGTVRDWLRHGKFNVTQGKNFDRSGSIGPWIVTPDEIPDPHDLAMTLRVNGDVRQTSHSGRMSTTIPEIISHYSPLGFSAGDVLSTGTVSGVAGFSEEAASLYLRPGDVIEAEIERIGVLRNPVVSWQEGHGEPAPARVRW